MNLPHIVHVLCTAAVTMAIAQQTEHDTLGNTGYLCTLNLHIFKAIQSRCRSEQIVQPNDLNITRTKTTNNKQKRKEDKTGKF